MIAVEKTLRLESREPLSTFPPPRRRREATIALVGQLGAKGWAMPRNYTCASESDVSGRVVKTETGLEEVDS